MNANVNVNPSGRRFKVSRTIYLVLAWLLVACIVLQTFLAGLAVFNDPEHWSSHAIFAHLFQYIPLLMIAFAFAGRMPKGSAWLSFALFAMIFSQNVTANLPAVGALHPVMALALIVLSLHVARRPLKHDNPGKQPTA